MRKLLVSLLIASVSITAIQAKRTKIKISEYTVQSGDTLFTIARKHHTTTEEVRKSNSLEKDQLIRIGQKLRVPTNTYFPKQKRSGKQSAKKIVKKSSTPKKGKVQYTISSGDTLFTIARKHHTTTQEVREANGMERNALIRVGQVLQVPTNTYFPKGTENTAVVVEKESSKGIYEVQSGDTLFSIAKKNHVTLKEIMALNAIEAGAVIKVGQKLKVSKKRSFIVSKKKAQKSKLVRKTYTIKRGDTLSKIARKYKTTVKKLRVLNKLGKRSRLKIGAVLAVGSMKVEIKKPKTYRVRKGDTLWLIAKRHHTTVKKLRALNKLSRRSKLHRGMVLAVDGKRKESIAKTSKQRIAKRKTTKRTKVASGTKRSNGKRLTDAMALLNGKGRRGSSRGSSRVIRTAKRYLGTRYVWGAEGPNRFDCSGFTQYVIRKSKGVRLPRVSRKQAYYGKYISRGNLRAGDLIFFDTSRRRRGYVNHVGIYIGSNKFIHASSAKHRVVISSLNRPFYNARFKWGRHYSLFTIHYSLFTIHYSLFTIHYSLFTIHYSLFTIHYL